LSIFPVHVHTSKSIWTYGQMDMDIWTYEHMDIRTCCRDEGCDYIVLKILTENVQNKKNTENLQVFLDVYSLEPFCHIWRYVLSHYTLCLFRRFVRIRFVTLHILSLYILSFRHFLSLYLFYTFCRHTFCYLKVLSDEN
jgi:hypothetical protein